MKLLSQISISRPTGESIIQLLSGDLSSIPREHAVDIIVISAYPNNYAPLPDTLVGALYNKGLDLTALSKSKAIDLSILLGCWLSGELTPQLQERFNTKRIVSFEPRILSNKPEEVVSNVFRCLNNFLIPDIETNETRGQRVPLDISDIAMPILATGNQRASVEVILPAILSAATFWFSNGLPVNCLKLVVYDIKEAEPSKQLFNHFASQWQQQQKIEAIGRLENIVLNKLSQARSWKQKITDRIGELLEEKMLDYLLLDLNSVADEEEKKVIKRVISKLEKSVEDNDNGSGNFSPELQYDYFISYAHTHSREIQEFINELSKVYKGAKIFYDRDNIPPGGLWIKQISQAIQHSKKVICILSPAYSNSPVCWDEFQCAKLKEYNTRQSVIKTISLYKDVSLPPIMGIYSYVDCTEGDIQKLKESVKEL